MIEVVVPPIPSTWWQRNWKWIVPVILLSMAATVAGFMVVVHLVVQTFFRSSDVYAQALARVHSNAEIIHELGEPVRPGWSIGGSVQTTIGSGNADLVIPLSGPSGRGTLYVIAQKKAGAWHFETLEFEVAGKQERIRLLGQEE